MYKQSFVKVGDNSLSMLDLMDDLLTPFEDGFFNLFSTLDAPVVSSRVPKDYVSSNFPPCNIYMNKEETCLYYKLAVAGYSKENIKVTYKDDYLTVSLMESEKEKKEEKENIIYAQKGIKHCSCETTYFVPSKKYDTSKLKVSLSDGILLIEIPVKEESKKIEYSIL